MRRQAGGLGLTLWHALVLGVIQGLTEFLPVSSSGHLVLGGVVLGLKEPHLAFDVMVHVATLVATVAFYRHSLRDMTLETWGSLQTARSRGLAEALRAHPEAKLTLWIVLGTVPTGLIGILFKEQLEGLFGQPAWVAGMLLGTAALLLLTAILPHGKSGPAQMRLWQALLIGLFQGMAIVPGISRSGSTIACGLLVGLNRELAARFSFLLSLPAILGALVLKVGEGELHGVGWDILSMGFVSSALVGLGALALLIPLVKRGRLHWFALYLIPAGLFGLWSLS